jgi:hypothetical protein
VKTETKIEHMSNGRQGANQEGQRILAVRGGTSLAPARSRRLMMMPTVLIGLAIWTLASVALGVMLGRTMDAGAPRVMPLAEAEKPPLRKAA